MTKTRALTIALVLLSIASCSKKAPLPDLAPSLLRDTPGDSVESVVFWIGDVGKAEFDKAPLLHKLAADIDQWSRVVERDSSVAVVILGDNIYPGGLRDPGRPEFWVDSTHLEAQVDIMRAAGARANRAFAVFVPGNHDWGHKFGAEGEQRLRNQEEFLNRRRAKGIQVTLLPSGGPGPAIVDIGRYTRIIIIDTAWWLLSPNDEEKQILMDRVLEAMVTAGDRSVSIATHHPFKSAGSHGGLQPFWATLGIKWLLTKSGAALQDLNSLPYRDFLDRLNVIFERTGPPMMFAGGHDHVLQVIKGTGRLDPQWMIVSGSGSKVSRVGHVDGMTYRGNKPGYMRMVVKKSGSIDMFVVAADKEFLSCDRGTPELNEQCVQAGIQAFRNEYGVTLR